MNWASRRSGDGPGLYGAGSGRTPPDDEARSRARWNVAYLALATAVLFVAILFPSQRSGWVIGLAAVAVGVILLGLNGEQHSDPWKRRRSVNPSWDRVNVACARWAPYATMVAVIAALIQSLRA